MSSMNVGPNSYDQKCTRNPSKDTVLEENSVLSNESITYTFHAQNIHQNQINKLARDIEL